ncbi:MAG: hypothetical protein J6X00_00495, partial [Clostridia bacterium]|nr:hypothetical protein [Clostridia bacterium]
MNGYQTIMVKCYLNDGTLVFTQSKTLLVVEAPRIVLTTLEGDKSGVIATGTSVQFNAKFYGTPDYWKVTTIEGLSIVDGINTFKHTPNGGITRESLNEACGDEIIITVSAENTISGIKFTTQDTIRYRVVKFVVDNIRVKRVENGYFNGKFNQIYPLHTELDVTYYKDELQSAFDEEVKKEVKALAEAIDGFGVLEYTYTDNLTYKLNDGKSKTWYSASGNSWVELEQGEKTNYTIRNVYGTKTEIRDDQEIETIDTSKILTLSIQNTNVYARDVLASIVRITYTDKGRAIITTQVDSSKDVNYHNIISYANYLTKNDGTNNVEDVESEQVYFDRYSYLFTRSFTFNFTRLLNEETPDPIYNVEQFKAMQPGGYYILQSDLVLDKWVPMEANFALLDGNMHVITINSFDISDASTSGSYIGLFSTVSRAYDPNYVNNSTVIQNLTVEISHDIVLDMTTYTNVSFGIIAGQNEGVITNCRVVNNAEDIINERLSNLFTMSGTNTEARNMYTSYVYTTQDLTDIGNLERTTVDNNKRHASAALNEIIGFDNFVYDYIQAKVEGNSVLSATNNNFIKVFDTNFQNVLPGFAISYSDVAGKYIVSWNGGNGNNEYNSIAEFVETYYQELLSAYNTIVRSDDYLTLIRDYFIEVYITRSQEDAKHPISESDVLLNRFKEIIGSDEIGNYGIYVAKYNQLVALPTDIGYAIISPQMYIKGHVNNATGNKIGGFVGSNTGYITNSSVENISIKGTDYVAGFAANNNGDISSSYFAGGNIVSDDSNSKQNSATAGFVVTNSKNIQYSYALGRYADDITGFDESTKNTFVGYKAYKAYINGNDSEEMQNIATLRALNSAVYTNTFGSGFVYKNSGYINNSYSNILVAATAGAGFVVSNNDENSYIENCYSMSTGSGEAFSAFTNKVSATTASDKVKDCYYLVIDAQDTNK